MYCSIVDKGIRVTSRRVVSSEEEQFSIEEIDITKLLKKKVTHNNGEWPINQSRFKAPGPKILSSLEDFGMAYC